MSSLCMRLSARLMLDIRYIAGMLSSSDDMLQKNDIGINEHINYCKLEVKCWNTGNRFPNFSLHNLYMYHSMVIVYQSIIVPTFNFSNILTVSNYLSG